MDALRQQLPQLSVTEFLELLHAIVAEIQSRIFFPPIGPIAHPMAMEFEESSESDQEPDI